MLATRNPDELVDAAILALATNPQWQPVLDELPAPVYTTDREGAVTYWNQACVEFAGRVPELGQDRWCVTWQLYTTSGERLPHDECPMAQAIREARVIRDTIAIAKRPDGTRRAFRPYPTPLLDQNGDLIGAVNILIDVTDEQSQALQEQAERCRRLAAALYSREGNAVLNHMADRFELSAADLKADNDG